MSRRGLRVGWCELNALTVGAQTVASQLVALLATRLQETPYCVIGHSLGTWVAFETLALAQESGLPMPKMVRQAKGTYVSA
jgi:surfactin synthase thioesterase subunit